MAKEIWIKSEGDMLQLQAAMHEIGTEAITIETYVDQWVCHTKGFEPTDACVLKPLASAMDSLRDAFNEALTTFFDRWDSVREGAATAVQAIERRDHETVKPLNVLMGEATQVVRLPNGKVMAE